MKEKWEIVYLKADRNSVCHDPKIKIQDVMSVQCADPAICAGIKNKTLYTFKKKDDRMWKLLVSGNRILWCNC